MRKLYALLVIALFLAGCGTTSKSQTVSNSSQGFNTATSSRSVNPPAIVVHTSVETLSRYSCNGKQVESTYSFGIGSSTVCNSALSLFVYVPSPRYSGAPVAISLDDQGIPTPVSVGVSTGKLFPLSPWMQQTSAQASSIFGRTFTTPPVATNFRNTVTTKTVSPSLPIPAQTGEFLAAWLWYSPSTTATLNVSGLKPVTVPQAVPLPAHVTISPQIAPSVTVGLSLTAPTPSASVARSWIIEHDISGTVFSTATGNPNVIPAVGPSRIETLAGDTFTWHSPKLGQSVTISDRVLNVPLGTSVATAVAADSVTGYIGLLTGLDVKWQSGPESVLITSHGPTKTRLTLTAPSRVQQGQSVLALVSVRQNGSAQTGQSVSFGVSPLPTGQNPWEFLHLTTGGIAHVTIRNLLPGRDVLTARTPQGLVATATVIVTQPVPWWLFVVIIAASVAVIVEVARRWRKHHRSGKDAPAESSEADE